MMTHRSPFIALSTSVLCLLALGTTAIVSSQASASKGFNESNQETNPIETTTLETVTIEASSGIPETIDLPEVTVVASPKKLKRVAQVTHDKVWTCGAWYTNALGGTNRDCGWK